MKKKLLYIAAIVICLSIMTGGTLAYRTVADTTRNIITSNGVGVEILEMQQLVNGQLQPYPGGAIPVMPNTKVSKIVRAKNNEASAWIRMNYTMTVTDANDNPLEIPQEELKKVILLNIDNTSWTEKEGWFYYNTALGKDQITEPLFTEVIFSGPNMDNRYQQTKLKLNVVVQAVQTANNGTTVMNADGWPKS